MTQFVGSLTSYPKRINCAVITVKSLLSQSAKLDSLYLNLCKKEFPNLKDDLPKELVSLEEENSNFIINFTDGNNIKSFKKLIPIYEKHHKQDVIITFDDDIIYPDFIIKEFKDAYKQDLNVIHALRCHKVVGYDDGKILPYGEWFQNISHSTPSFLNFFTGCSGVLYPPNSLDDRVVDESKFTLTCPQGDDIWFWAHALLKGTKINQVEPAFEPWPDYTIKDSQETCLWKTNCDEGMNDKQLKSVFELYPQLNEIVHADLIKEYSQKGNLFSRFLIKGYCSYSLIGKNVLSLKLLSDKKVELCLFDKITFQKNVRVKRGKRYLKFCGLKWYLPDLDNKTYEDQLYLR